jgi:hypothetical protein
MEHVLLSAISPSDILEWIKTLGPTLAAAGTCFAAGVACYVYAKNARLERAKWAHKLHESFYETDRYKKMRRAIDSNKTKGEMVSLSITDDFYDFLIFFEFVAILWNIKQLKLKEVRSLFDYWLLKLLENKVIMDTIENPALSYENLEKLLKELKKKQQ